MKGLFGDLCDFNHDGDLDSIEQAAEFELFNQMMKDDDDGRRDEFGDDGLDSDDSE